MVVRLARVITLGLMLLVLSATSHGEWHSDTRPIMGTSVSVTLWHPDAGVAASAIAAVMEEMQRIDRLWNPTSLASELYRVNQRAAVEPVSFGPRPQPLYRPILPRRFRLNRSMS